MSKPIIILLSVINGTALLIGLGIYIGSKWIDRMLSVPPPLDPSKPIVRRARDHD